MEKSLPDIAANSMGFAVASEHYRPYPTYRDSGSRVVGEDSLTLESEENFTFVCGRKRHYAAHGLL